MMGSLAKVIAIFILSMALQHCKVKDVNNRDVWIPVSMSKGKIWLVANEINI